MAVLPIGIGSEEAGGYQIERSLRFNSADSAYLNRTPGSAGNRQKFTISKWLKLGRTVESGQTDYGNVINAYSSGDDNGYTVLEFHQNTLRFRGWNTTWRQTSAVYRDPSAWYHVVVAVDTTQATAANRIKMYVNGVEITAFSTNNNPSQNANLAFNSTGTHRIGQDNAASSSRKYDGYMAEMHLVDGSQLAASDFGEFNTDTGVWQPKAYSGSYGTNGFYLDFGDNSSTTALGYDAAGSNDWTPNNFSVTAGAGNDSLVDSPTRYGTDTGVGGEVRGNYATFNPLDKGSSVTLANGNLVATLPEQPVCSTIGASSGKYYVETTIETQGSVLIGWVNASYYPSQGQPWDSGDNALYYSANGQKVINNSFTSYASSAASGDVIGVAVDFDSNSIEFFKNGTSLGSFSKTFSGNYKFVVADATSATNTVITLNAGQRPFSYTAPSGFKALCTTNLPEPTIADGGSYFNAVTYTGNGSTQSITGVGFQPDFTWLKGRSVAYSHRLFDVIRGATKSLISNSTAAEATEVDQLTAFGSDGFTLGSNAGTNESSQTYVAWQWKANGSGVSNTDGSITSTVSANTTSGFSIVTYTGTGTSGTVGHGLGQTPAMIITKRRDSSDQGEWQVSHQSLSGGITGNGLFLNTTAAQFSTGGWISSVSSTTVGLSSATSNNGSGRSFVMYAFSPVEGFSAFGSFVGNGSADGPFIFTGHRPSYVLIKRTSATEDWAVFDSTRNPSNLTNLLLSPNLSSAETTVTGNPIDILSNGFKIRGTGNTVNGSGSTYIYMAFAENPFKYALAR